MSYLHVMLQQARLFYSMHILTLQYDTHTHTHFSSVLHPAQGSERALSLIAFSRPLIILMVLHATQWSSVCLRHIELTHSPPG